MGKAEELERVRLEKATEALKLEKRRPCFSKKKYEGIEWCDHRINAKFCPFCKAEQEKKQAEKAEKQAEKAKKKGKENKADAA